MSARLYSIKAGLGNTLIKNAARPGFFALGLSALLDQFADALSALVTNFRVAFRPEIFSAFLAAHPTSLFHRHLALIVLATSIIGHYYLLQNREDLGEY
jgi:hypothetical protein